MACPKSHRVLIRKLRIDFLSSAPALTPSGQRTLPGLKAIQRSSASTWHRPCSQVKVVIPAGSPSHLLLEFNFINYPFVTVTPYSPHWFILFSQHASLRIRTLNWPWPSTELCPFPLYHQSPPETPLFFFTSPFTDPWSPYDLRQ